MQFKYCLIAIVIAMYIALITAQLDFTPHVRCAAQSDESGCGTIKSCQWINNICRPRKVTRPHLKPHLTIEPIPTPQTMEQTVNKVILSQLFEDESILQVDGEIVTNELLDDLTVLEGDDLLQAAKDIYVLKKGPLRSQENAIRRIDDGSLEEHTQTIQVKPILTVLESTDDHIEYNFDIEINNLKESELIVNDFTLQFLYDEDYAFVGDFKNCTINDKLHQYLKPLNIKPITNDKTKLTLNEELNADLDLQFSNAVGISKIVLKPGQKMNFKCIDTTLVRGITAPTAPTANNNKFHERNLPTDSIALMKFQTQTLTKNGQKLKITNISDFKSSFTPYKWIILAGGLTLLVLTLALIGFIVAKKLKAHEHASTSKSTQSTEVAQAVDALDASIPEEQQSLLGASSSNEYPIV